MRSKNLLSILATVVILASVVAPMLLIGGAAKAQDTITLSSTNLNPKKVIAIDVRGDLGDNVTLRVLDRYGQPVNLTRLDTPGVNVTEFIGTKIAPGRYIAYLGGEQVNLNINPAYPLVSRSAHSESFAKFAVPGTRGDTYTIWVVGTDITATFLYDTVKMTLTLSPKEVAYRRGEAVISFTIADGDLNLDPTAADEVGPIGINMTLVVFKAAGGEYLYSGTLNDLVITSIKETAVNSATFTTRTNVAKINSLLPEPISESDKIVITLLALEDAQGWDDWKPPYPDQRGSDYVTAVYRAPTVSVSFTNQYVTIDITSPDDNVNPADKDTLDPGAKVYLEVYNEYNDFDNYIEISASLIKETDKNTGVFRLRIPVSWNTIASLTTTSVVLKTECRGPFYFYVRYYNTTRDPGYNIDARGLGQYDPKIASVEITRATTKTILATVSDADLNNRADAIEYLTAEYTSPSPTRNVTDITLYRVNIPLAKVVLLDTKGNIIKVETGKLASDVVSFVETDMNTGVFTLRINAANLEGIIPGAQYVLRYYDWTGEKTGVYKDYIFTISEIGVSLDRTEIPVNMAGVIVYITYINDMYNADPTKRDSAYVNATIIAADGTVLFPSTQLTLTENGINTGVFTKAWKIEEGNFSTPKIIDAKLKVWDPAYPDIKPVEAYFRAHDSDIEVTPTAIKWGDTITIKVKDPDANVDTKDKDSVTVGIIYGTTVVKNVTLVETDVNSNEFVGKVRVSWDDPNFKNIPPGTILKVRYTDGTPIMSPTASSWREVPYVATFKVISTDGALTVTTAEAGYLGVLEELKGDKVKVVDIDMNRKVLIAETLPDALAVSIEAIPETPSYNLGETEANSGAFILPSGVTLSLYDALERTGIMPSAPTARQRAEILAGYIGKKMAISYIDEYDATGARRIITETLTLKAWTATIATSAEAVNLNEWLTITITNKDIAGTTITEYKQAIVKSTSYPAGLMFYLEEVSPGVFQLKIQVVSVTGWVPGAKQIPAKLGDTITIEYVDPVTADGKANVLLTKTVVVGVPIERPVPASAVKFADPITGAEKTAGKVGEMILLQAVVKNVDVVERVCTVVIKVKDAAGATIYIGTATATLAPGQEFAPGITWVPTLAGDYTIEVIVVKSLAEPTPYSDKITATLTVTA
ncbi:MAG: hypothetical protein QW290_07910 [Sulfolobales archaeon]